MYNIHKAAAILGITERTVRTWMKQCGLKTRVLETDRRRAYILDEDMLVLVGRIDQKSRRAEEKIKTHNRNSKKVVTTGEVTYYCLADAALMLSVSVSTVKRWIAQDKIEKKPFTTDNTRAYIAQDDVLRLAELHGRKLSAKELGDMKIQREVTATEPDMDKLCSLKEVTLYLDVSYRTVVNWIREDNIDKKMVFTNRGRACIAYRDVLELAERHGREVVPNPSPLTVAEEIKVIKGRLDKLTSDVEDIKHDFRIFAKRAIYIR